MHSPINTAQMNRRFDGFRKTPFLWENLLEGLVMFSTGEFSITDFPIIDSTSRIRLGKLMEQFVMFELEKDESVQILRSNIQVFHEQITIGELDCLLNQSGVNIHLEIVYKFYLYDPSISTELERWIGPNRNDTMVLKLNKLKERQLPLLYRPETTGLLNELKIKSDEIQQRVYFKAQLFVPLNSQETLYEFVNQDCIIGFYIRQKDLDLFENHSFYIPSKLDWVVGPHLDVTWLSTLAFQETISELLATHRSPLCWMKSDDGKLQKFFVVWWD